MTHFRKINTIFRALIWKKQYARIKLETLQREKVDGGLAIPNPWLYFLAAQLQHFVGWHAEEGMDASGRVLARWSGRGRPCYELEAGGTSENRRRFPTLALMYKVWDRGKRLLGLEGCTAYTPIWSNPTLVEFLKLRGFEEWAVKGVQTVAHLQTGGILKSFEVLQADFGIPRHWFYQFLQLRHAFNAQAQIGDLRPQSEPCLDALLQSACTKGVISMIYKALLLKFLEMHPLLIRERWESEVGPLSDAQWDTVLSQTPTLSPSEAQRLSQLFLLHRVYKSPSLMFRIGIREDSTCPRCSRIDAHLMHVLWECPELGAFWNAVLDLVHQVHGLRLSTDPKICILGILDDLDSESPIALSISRMLFQARKLIAQHWIRPSPPSIGEYKSRMNNAIRLEKAVYVKRKASHKYEAIWGPWLDTPGLPSQILVQHRVIWSS